MDWGNTFLDGQSNISLHGNIAKDPKSDIHGQQLLRAVLDFNSQRLKDIQASLKIEIGHEAQSGNKIEKDNKDQKDTLITEDDPDENVDTDTEEEEDSNIIEEDLDAAHNIDTEIEEFFYWAPNAAVVWGMLWPMPIYRVRQQNKRFRKMLVTFIPHKKTEKIKKS